MFLFFNATMNYSYNLNRTDQQSKNTLDTFISFIPLVIIVFALVFNTISFIIFRFHAEFKVMSSMVYLSFVTITYTLSLFVWNLNHFIGYNFNVYVENFGIFVCHFGTFIQYFSLESSAILLSMVTIDRYVTVMSIPGSSVSKLPFRTARSALFWSLGILATISLLNIHLLVIPRLKTNDSVGYNCYIYYNGFSLFPFWENVHLAIFTLIPFILMTIFNGLLIRSIITAGSTASQDKSKSNKMSQRKKRVTASLILVTGLFLVLTLPTSICFGFFYSYFINNHNGQRYLVILDCISFLNSSSLFFITFATNSKFRSVIWNYLKNFREIYINKSENRTVCNYIITK